MVRILQAADLSPLLLIGLIIIIIVIIIGRGQKTRRFSEAQVILKEGKYSQAAEIFIELKKWSEVADVILQSPQGVQTLLYRRLTNLIEPSRIKNIFLTLGDHYIRTEYILRAASAYNYAGLPWKAAQTYILAGTEYIDQAIRILDSNPTLIRDRERAIRNLAKYAYDNQKVIEAAELLRLIGAEEEASAVLIAAGKNVSSVPQMRTQQTIEGLDDQLKQIFSGIKQGKFIPAEEHLNRLIPVINNLRAKNIPEATNVLNNYARAQSCFENLKKARQALKEADYKTAQISYSELIDYANNFLPAEIFAEAALSYEKDNNLEVAREYYLSAAERAVTAQAQNSYRNRAQTLLTNIPAQVSASSTPTLSTPSTNISTGLNTTIQTQEELVCCICKRKIQTGEDLARCDQCGSVGHYGHFAEWIKIKGTCPVCRRKIHLPEKT